MNVIIKGEETGRDYKNALKLKKIFEEETRKHPGKMLIFPSFQCYGQEVQDIDFFCFGYFSNYFSKHYYINYQEKRNGEWVSVNDFRNREVKIYNFAFIIEEKSHDPESITFETGSIYVKYNGKRKDALKQSEIQKYSILNFFKYKGFKNIFFNNFVWLTNVSKAEIPTKKYPSCLSSDMSFDDIILANLRLKPPSYREHELCFSCTKQNIDYLKDAEKKITEIIDDMDKFKKNPGKITREKVEYLSKRYIKNQKFAISIGKKLLIITGRAGTGKTIKILRLANDLAHNHNKRCLILTYNRALKDDIKRLITFIDIKDEFKNGSIDIMTIHKYIYELSKEIGWLDKNSDFKKKYEKIKEDIIELMKKDILNKKNNQYEMMNWDVVLVDEGQDCPDNEKELFIGLFGSENIVVANGVDQLVRQKTNTDWKKNVYPKPFESTKGQLRSLRQKRNLCLFVDKVAQYFKIGWKIDPSDNLNGGKVIISDHFDFEVYKQLYEGCIDNGNIGYDMLFLATPKFVENIKIRFLKYFKKRNVNFWDGTDKETLRKLHIDYPTDPSLHRLLQYDSCRGSEGWDVVCNRYDDFFKYKMETYEEKKSEIGKQIWIDSPENDKRNWCYKWALIPLTRAIDTLFIHLVDYNSEFSQKVLAAAKDCSDFVEVKPETKKLL